MSEHAYGHNCRSYYPTAQAAYDRYMKAIDTIQQLSQRDLETDPSKLNEAMESGSHKTESINA